MCTYTVYTHQMAKCSPFIQFVLVFDIIESAVNMNKNDHFDRLNRNFHIIL